MKNTHNKTMGLFILFITLNMVAQQRNVTWVHGLDGNKASWFHYEEIFTNELTEFTNDTSQITDYDTDNGITIAANEVITKMETFYDTNANSPSSNNARNLGIGHSMGGLMIREVDHLKDGSPKKFGGYITVCTSNYGAPISNAVLDGSLVDAAQNAALHLNAGPMSVFMSLPFDLGTYLNTHILANKYIDNDLIYKRQGTPVANADLRVGSPTIDAINTYTDTQNPNIPRISIWAQENSPVHWRMFSSSQYKNEPDTKLPNKVSNARAIYSLNYYLHRSAAVFYITIFRHSFSILNPAAGYKAQQWKRGRNWIDSSENIWSALIKTSRVEEQTYWALNTNFGGNIWDGSNPLDFSWEQRTRLVSVNYPSDGLLPTYTQIMLNNPTLNNAYEVSGANHIEVRNMTVDGNGVDETKEVFNLIFNRPNNDWFETN